MTRPRGEPSRWWHLRRGLGLGYPVCCVASFVLDPRPRKAARRGVIDMGLRPDLSTWRWVPCRWHMRRHPRWRPLRSVR